MNIKEKYEQSAKSFTSMTPKGTQMYETAKKTLPGGETRSATNMYPHPMYIEKAVGTMLYDVDGNEFKDFINNYTSMIHGHAHPFIDEKITEALKKGIGVTAVLPEQVELSKILCDRIPGMEQLRFCNSGTEAAMFAVRAARAIRKCDKIIKIEGCYHGTSDILEFNFSPPKLQDSNSFHTEPVPDCAGVPYKIGEDIIFAPFNDLNIIEKELKNYGDCIACIILEPILGAAGFVIPKPGYLKGLRELADKYGVLLIFDEVQTLRLSVGGMQKIENVVPDLTAMGKIFGGGLPVGAVGGKADIMQVFSGGLDATLSHSGTFNGCRAVMAGGIAAMNMLDQAAIDNINAMGDKLAEGINKLIDKHKIAASVSHWGSLLHIHFVESVPTNYQETISPNPMLNDLFHLELVKRGLYVAPRGSWALSTIMTNSDIDFALKTVDECFSEIKPYSV